MGRAHLLVLKERGPFLCVVSDYSESFGVVGNEKPSEIVII